MRIASRILPALVLAAVCAAPTASALAAADGPVVAFTLRDPRITESSGLAASRLHRDVYWTHDDSGDGPYVYAVDGRTGRTLARVTLRGVTARDCEAISSGPDGDLYLADIGDNLGGAWPSVRVYRFPEPRALHDQSVRVTTYTVRYSDGPRDAEALMVDPRTGRVYIASKNIRGGRLYRGPARLSAAAVNVFHPIADVPWVTDGAFSPDGSRLLLRGYFGATDYRWRGGRPRLLDTVDLPAQPQGESVTYTPDGRALMVGSEGAGSRVWRVPLTGADLPDADTAPVSAARRAGAGESGSPPPPAGSGARHGGGPGGYPAAVAALIAATALTAGLRRLLRRGANGPSGRP